MGILAPARDTSDGSREVSSRLGSSTCPSTALRCATPEATTPTTRTTTGPAMVHGTRICSFWDRSPGTRARTTSSFKRRSGTYLIWPIATSKILRQFGARDAQDHGDVSFNSHIVF